MIWTLMFLFIAVAAEDNKVNPDIVYKYSDDFELIWKDQGSGATRNGALWRALNYQQTFCSLGDIATGDWDLPTDKAVFVSERKAGALVNPTSFTIIWKDQGSGSDADVTIYKMNAPDGYTCLGGVALNSYHVKPDPKKYCCVKNEYLVEADAMFIWNDSGSDSSMDVSLWRGIRTGGEAFGLHTGTFIPARGYYRPDASSIYLLKADESKVRDLWTLPTDESKSLNLHEVEEMKLIWNDMGTHARFDVSIWRAESKKGYFPPADIAVGSYTKPGIGFLLRPTDKNGDEVRPPISYNKIWNDAGSGATRNVQIWSVNCPGGYVPLGNVATSGAEPELGSVYCVKITFTTYGSVNNWEKVWSNQGPGGRGNGVTIYEAKSDDQQSVRGFGVAHGYENKPRPPYFLNTEFVNYLAEKPIEKIEMYNVDYDINGEQQQTSPVSIATTVLTNPNDNVQEASRTIMVSYTNSDTFTFTQAIQVGIEVEMTAGIPLINHKTTIGVQYTSTWISGSTNTTIKRDQATATVMVPPHSRQTAYIIGKEYKADIPYTATIKKIYFDGTYGIAKVTGVYKGVAINTIEVTYGTTEPLPEDDPEDDPEE